MKLCVSVTSRNQEKFLIFFSNLYEKSCDKAMFEVLLSHGHPIIDNCSTVNFDKFKIKKFNRTTIVIDGTFLLSIDVDETIFVRIFETFNQQFFNNSDQS
jgi:hypothetical protein